MEIVGSPHFSPRSGVSAGSVEMNGGDSNKEPEGLRRKLKTTLERSSTGIWMNNPLRYGSIGSATL